MKIVYEKDEIKTLEEKYPKSPIIFDSDTEKEYSINFKVKNPVIAQEIIIKLLSNKCDDFDMGIEVTSLNLEPYKSINDIKEKLYKMIEDL